MADRPIIFSAPMVNALLAGRKTQTRRIIKPQPVWNSSCGDRDGFWSGDAFMRVSSRFAAGDRLWVREAFAEHPGGTILDAAGGCEDFIAPYVEYRADTARPCIGKWRSPIHMPRSLSRLTLTVTDVRVQRVQEITEADAKAEGVDWEEVCCGDHKMSSGCCGQPIARSPAEVYGRLWNHLHGPGAWEADPYVVALTFAVAQKHIDA